MSGTFSSLGIAASALRYHQAAMDVTAGNIANARTEGYTRRRAEAQTIGAPAVPALWSRHDGVGEGVAMAAVTRANDPLLDARQRREHAEQARLDTRVTVLDRVESALGEPGDTGVAQAMNDFRAAWEDLANHPEVSASRSQVIATGQALADAVRAQATGITSELSALRGQVQGLAAEVSTAAHDLAALNRGIVAARVAGIDHHDLLDQRDQLALQLAESVGAVTSVRPDGAVDVAVGGVALVTGGQAATFAVATGVAPDGSSDGAALSFSLSGAGGTQTVPGSAVGGEAGALVELVDTTLPTHLADLDAVARQLAADVNALHTAGHDRDGTPGTAFFAHDATSAALSLRVVVAGPDQVAASGIAGGGLDTATAEAIGDLRGHDEAYARLVSAFGSTVLSITRQSQTQRLLTTQVDSAREQLAGVSIDEETVDLLASQRAYEAAARVLTTLDDVLDTLINRTGVTR